MENERRNIREVDSETLLEWFQKLCDCSYRKERDLIALPFDRAETREEIVRRMEAQI